MNSDELEKKLDITFVNNLQVDINSGFKDDIADFKEKLARLLIAGRYKKLIKSILSSKDRKEFNTYVFEVLFAYHFESKGLPLLYEVKQICNSVSSIDFLLTTKEEVKIYFELRLLYQKESLNSYIKSQLNNTGMYEVIRNGQDEKDEIIRLQNLILNKCQDKNRNPIKFYRNPQVANTYNIIVVYVSDLFLTMIDKDDCMLSMYGDQAVPPYAQRKIFGLCQELSGISPDWVKECYYKFKHFRETIHGVLFVKNSAQPMRHYGDLILDLELEYYLIGNNNLIEKDKFSEICKELQKYLNPWSKNQSHLLKNQISNRHLFKTAEGFLEKLAAGVSGTYTGIHE